MKNILTKENKGITLVALIITIIVLLILAVVTISAVNEGSLFSHANNAAKTYSEKAAEENSIIARYLSKLEGNDTNIKFTIGALASRATSFNTEDKTFEIPVSEFNDLIGANIVDLKDYYFRTDENSYILAADMSDLKIEDEGTVVLILFLALAEVPNEELGDALGFSIESVNGSTQPDFLCATLLAFPNGIGPNSMLSFAVGAQLNEESIAYSSVEEMPEEIKNYEIKLLNLRKMKDLYRKYADNAEDYDF